VGWQLTVAGLEGRRLARLRATPLDAQADDTARGHLVAQA
jgi:hypothetical protein